MPKGPKGEKRPADVIGLAVTVAKIATGEIEDKPQGDGKDPAAQALGKRGGKARADKLTSDARSEIARKAARKRWGQDYTRFAWSEHSPIFQSAVLHPR